MNKSWVGCRNVFKQAPKGAGKTTYVTRRTRKSSVESKRITSVFSHEKKRRSWVPISDRMISSLLKEYRRTLSTTKVRWITFDHIRPTSFPSKWKRAFTSIILLKLSHSEQDKNKDLYCTVPTSNKSIISSLSWSSASRNRSNFIIFSNLLWSPALKCSPTGENAIASDWKSRDPVTYPQ